MKRFRAAAIIAAVVIAGGLTLAGSASAATAAPSAVSGDATTATVVTPAGSFHIPVVPYTGSSSSPFSGAFNTTFTLYTLPACPSGSVFWEVDLATPGTEQDVNPPLGSTTTLTSDDTGNLAGTVGANGALPTPFTHVDFSASGLNGSINAAGDYSLVVKCFSNTALTSAWWTTVDFDGPLTSTNAPNWKWEPLDNI